MGIFDSLKKVGGYDMLHSFLHPEDAYGAAQKAETGAYEEGKKYQLPYQQAGTEQLGRLNEAENSLLNPQDLISKWLSGYENSPWAKQLLEQNQASGLDAASQMGLSGSSAALGNIQQGAGNIVKQDRETFLNDLMKQYLEGIGLGKSIYETGANTAAGLGTNALRHGENIAGLEYGRTAAPGEMFGKLLGFGANAAGGGGGSTFNAGNKFNPAQFAAMAGGA